MQSAEPKIIVDEATFNQILELDEDDTFDFSTEMVIQYFQQATTTFEEMQSALYVSGYVNATRKADYRHQ